MRLMGMITLEFSFFIIDIEPFVLLIIPEAPSAQIPIVPQDKPFVSRYDDPTLIRTQPLIVGTS